MKQTLTIPTDLRDITLQQYQRFLRVADGNDDETFIRQKMVQIFCGVELRYIDNIPQRDFIEITDTIAKTLENEPKLVQTFELKGKKYGFIPNLDKITLGEFVDLDNTLGNWDKMQEAMSVLYREIKEDKGEKYLIFPYDGEKNPDFEHIPMDVVIGSMLFFYRLSIELLNYTLNYSQKTLQTKIVQERLQKDLMKNGVGIPQLSNSLMGITQELRKSLIKTFIPPCFIYAT